MRPGGALVYITCSLLDAENDAQIAAFLEAQPEFEAVPMAPRLDALGPEMAERVHLTAEGGVLLTPLLTGTDGFFVMVMRRR